MKWLLYSSIALAIMLMPVGNDSATWAGQKATPDNPHGTYAEDCSLCHGDEGWKPVRISPKFKHAPKRFPLEGAHAQTDCRACHASLDFRGAKPASECVSCHQDVHEGELGADCVRCHSARSFIEHSRMVRAHQATRFPLVGAHVAADCEGCHIGVPRGNLTYVNISTDCESCHLPEYNATTDPPHQAAGFPPDCRLCHTPITWPSTSNVGFDHSTTGFALTGGHLNVLCAKCHVGGVYTGLNPACVSCHQDDYDGTKNPPHIAPTFPTDCTSCHGTSAWTPANFNHGATGFPLTGAHLSVSCSKCHFGGVYTGLNPACVSCHQDDYDGTTNPPHLASSFPTDCTSCHGTSAWIPSNWNHDSLYFPIYSGAHDNKWSTCATCHTNSGNFAQFSCYAGCHEHSSPTEMAGKHSGVSGYAYDSQSCYNCHPRGRH